MGELQKKRRNFDFVSCIERDLSKYISDRNRRAELKT